MVKNHEFEVFLLPIASKELERLPKKIQKQIKDFLKNLNQPLLVSSRKLKGADDTYRVRIGDYRVLYKIYFEENIVVIIKIAHRKHAYK
ncbi:MAG: Toxin RelE [Candidatus Heimdallarchaeota archaeon AB_125]|nr:MAG: Toxin RelE [Candidatus Heimdallarchaeota archaeon AB_125]